MSASRDELPMLGPKPAPETVVEFLPPEPEPPWRPSAGVWRFSTLLFLLTCGSTFWVGWRYYSGLPPQIDFASALRLWMQGGPQHDLIARSIRSGLIYSSSVMGILLFHELGHYLQARRYGVPAIPPVFIPMPFFPFGTMGAVIVQSPHHADRKAMFDIAISGPLAGLVLALPIAWVGISQSQTQVFDGTRGAQIFGDPLILKWMIRAVHGPLAPNEDVLINPLLMAGWIGVFITALNLTPVGQLDGGHILYCLIGRRAHVVATVFVALLVGYMAFTGEWTFIVMVLLMLAMGVKHPPTANDRAPLGTARIVLGWLTLAFLFVGMTPRPFEQRPPSEPAPVVEPAER